MAAVSKRSHSPEKEHSTKKSKTEVKIDPDIPSLDDMDELDEFALARLRCFGVDSDALAAAAVASIAPSGDKEKKGARKTQLTNQEEKELRRERGELLLKLFREVPWLADSASARRAEKNQERAQMWEVITQKVNKNFGDKLEYLSVDKVKKLLTYYKKKDDGSYDNIKNALPLDDEHEDNVEASTVVSESRSESGDDDNSTAKGLVLIEEKEDGNKQLMEFLASMASSDDKTKEDKPHTVANSESLYQLKKDRHDFVVSQAEHYMDRMCFDNSSRSAAVNAERHCMWIKITHKANEKFAEVLGPLGVEQAKKLYSNCKRRRRVKAEMSTSKFKEDGFMEDQRGDCTTPDETNDHSSLMDEVTDFETPAATNFEELIRGLDRSVEIDELRRQLKDKDAEIERLKKKVAEQAAEYSARVKSVVELLKVAVDKKASDDIRSFLS